MAELAPLPADQLKKLRNRAKMSLAKLARAAGFKNASGIQRYENPRLTRRYLPAHFVKRIAPVLIGKGDPPIESREIYELTDEFLLVGAEHADVAKAAIEAAERDAARNAVKSDVSEPIEGDLGRAKDLPVYSSAEGGPNGAMVISNEAVDWVLRPQPLVAVKNAYAVYVVNDSMSPAYDHGDLLLIDPSRPPRGGDDCLFVMSGPDGDRSALVKRLIRATADQWRVRQYNPPKDFDLSRTTWRQALKVIGKYRP